ncbi:collagen alpha-1(I) chain-like [Corvus cornix cornix]|uniref:collagen alpha-1(I) chain-like n=1 Tax=Corvus cornix cornix TaxID=932674 RepID=UPI00194E7756|nr:collagen alpha-1(I) chain-like [Corvus cornix cornix]
MPGGRPEDPAAPPARPGGRGGMSRRPRAAEPSPPARRWNETRVKVDRRNPFWRGGRAADGRRGRRWRRRAPKVPRRPPPPPPPPPVRGWFPARRRPPCRAPLRALPFTVAPEGQKKGGYGGVSGEQSPPIPGRATLGTGGSITATGQPWRQVFHSCLSPHRLGQGDPPPKSGRGASLSLGQHAVNAGGSRVPSPAEVWGSQRRYGEQRKAEGGGPGGPAGPGLRERSEERAAVPGTRRLRRRERSGWPPARSPAFPLRKEPQTKTHGSDRSSVPTQASEASGCSLGCRDLPGLGCPRCRPPGRGSSRPTQPARESALVAGRIRRAPSSPPFSPFHPQLPRGHGARGTAASPRGSAGAERCGPGGGGVPGAARWGPGGHRPTVPGLRGPGLPREHSGRRDRRGVAPRTGEAALGPFGVAAGAGTARTPESAGEGRADPTAEGSGLPARPGLHRGGTRARGRSCGPRPGLRSRPVPVPSPLHSAIARALAPTQPEAAAAPARSPAAPAVRERRSTCRGAERAPPAALRCALGPAAPLRPDTLPVVPHAVEAPTSSPLPRPGPERAERWHRQTGDWQRVRTDLLPSRAFFALPSWTGKGVGQPRSQAASAGRPRHRALAVGDEPSNPVAVGGVPVPPRYRDPSFGVRFRRGSRNETKMSLSPRAGGARLCRQHFEGRTLAPADSAGGSTAPAIVLSQPQAAALPGQHKLRTAAVRRGSAAAAGAVAGPPGESPGSAAQRLGPAGAGSASPEHRRPPPAPSGSRRLVRAPQATPVLFAPGRAVSPASPRGGRATQEKSVPPAAHCPSCGVNECGKGLQQRAVTLGPGASPAPAFTPLTCLRGAECRGTPLFPSNLPLARYENE